MTIRLLDQVLLLLLLLMLLHCGRLLLHLLLLLLLDLFLLLLLDKAENELTLMTVITMTILFPVTQDSSAHIAIKHIRK
jgi:hypothetical protein